MTFDEWGYPTEETLKEIENFGLGMYLEKLPDYLALVTEWFRCPNWKYNRKTGCLQISTVGWSGNEDILTAMKHNDFWTYFWYQSQTGGHYWFRLYQFDTEGRRYLPKFDPLEAIND